MYQNFFPLNINATEAMKSPLLFLMLFFAMLFSAPVSGQQLDEALEAHITRMMTLEDIPGLSIAVRGADGSVHFHNFGTAGLEQETAVTEHTLFEIGSITKTFTGSLFLMLMEEHGFGMDTPVNELLAGSGLQLPDQGDARITLKQLMTHTSGLPRLPGNMSPANERDPYRDYTTELLKAYSAEVQPQRAPGEGWEYSNYAFMIAGFLAGHLEGRDFDALIHERITGPLGMTRTWREVPGELQADVADGSIFGSYAPAWHFDELRGLGELRSTTSDMMRYLEAQLGTADFPYSAALQRGHEPLHTFAELNHMGFSWFIRDLEEGGQLIYHGGGTGGFRAAAAFSPASGRAAVVLTNSNTDVQDLALHLTDAAFPLRELPDAQALPQSLLDQVTGLYQNPNLPLFEFFARDGLLMGQLEGQPALPLEHVEGYTFRNQTVAARIVFQVTGREPATGLVLHQGGMELVFERIEERPAGPVAVPMSAEALAEFAGTYHSGIGLSYDIRAAEGYLSARLTGQPAAKVLPEGGDRFFYESVPAALQFRRDESGRITGVVLLQAGQEIPFERGE